MAYAFRLLTQIEWTLVLARTILGCGSLSVLMGSTTWAAAPKPIFPSDSENPQQSEGPELLEAVCPGRVTIGKAIACRIVCPQFTGFTNEHFTWTLVSMTRGHFLSPTSDDAVLSMLGCEPHSANNGGTILITRRSGRWTMLWYKAGVETAQCHKVPLRSRRELLVCMGEYGAQGDIWTALYLEDLRSPRSTLMAGEIQFFQTFDNTLTCGANQDNGPEPLTEAHIEKVEFGISRSGNSVISVTAGFGKRLMKAEDVEACLDEQNPMKPHRALNFHPPMKKYHMHFVFNGHDYKPTPSSFAAAQVFASN